MKIFKRQGVTWAGKIALSIYPNILKYFSDQVKSGIFICCGTNGKTTTNNILCSALENAGHKVVCNHTGSNMLNGVTAAFVLASSAAGKIGADYACLEVDEASARKVLAFFKPDYMLLTNLFRDQLDRYGEIDSTIDILLDAIAMAPDMKLIFCADDPLSYQLALASGNKIITYGVKEQTTEQVPSTQIREGRFCKKCGTKLNYDFYHYGQLGQYHCEVCDFKRPEIIFNACNIKANAQISFTVKDDLIQANYQYFYNVYNILAAYAAARQAGVTAKEFNSALSNIKAKNGRNENFNIQGKKITLNLAKNPAGFNQNIMGLAQDPSKKDVIIVINDNEQDGTDISWLWDVDFEKFKLDNMENIIVSGMRAQDMRLRLKYVDIESQLIKKVDEAISERLKNGHNKLYVLVNYTALFQTRQSLKKIEDTK
ncbi:MAG: DUF1727 domain-containing protein [Eggerthellaceae bacterium]|nr:DUF1727 domain-containing protein [Eggerthellaceae bacterium]